MAEINEIISKQAIDDIIKLNEAFLKLESNMTGVLNNSQKLNEQLNKTAQSAASAEQKQKEYSNILNETTNNQKELNAQQKQLESTQAKLDDLYSDVNKQLIKNKQLLADRKKALEESIRTEGLADSSLVKMRQRLRELTKAYDEGSVRTKAQTKEISKLSNEIAKAEGATGRHNRLVGDYANQIAGMPGKIGTMASSVLQLGKAFLATPIGWIVAGFTAIVAIFKDFKPLIDKIEQGFAGLKAGFESLKNGIVSLVTGQGSFKDLGENMKNAAKEAAALKKAQQDLEEQANANQVQNASLETQIQQLILQSKNRTLSEKERMALIDKAMMLENKRHDNNKKIVDEEVEQAYRRIIAGKNLTEEQIKQLRHGGVAAAYELQNKTQISDAEIDTLRDALIKKEGIEQESISILEKAQNRRDALDDKATEERNKRLEEQKQNLEKYQTKVNALSDKATELEQKRISDRKKDEQDLTDFLEEQSFDIVEVKENEAALIDAMIENTKKNAEIKYRQQVLLIKATSKTEQEVAEKIAALDESNLQGTINNIQSQLEQSTLSAEKRLELETQLAEAQINLDDAVFERKKSNEEKATELRKAALEGTMQVAGALFDFMSSGYDNELKLLEEKNNQGLLSDKEYAKQKAEIEIKQAKLKKIQGIFEIGINTATAVIGMLKDPGGVAGGILAVAAGITGGLQLAKVLSEPLPTIPAFAKGTTNAPAIGLAGEAGTELGILKTGESILFDKPTVFAGEQFKGMHIFPNNEYEMMKASNGGSYSKSENSVLAAKLDSLERTIKDKPVFIFDKDKNIVGAKIGNRTEHYINRLKFGN